MFNRKPMSPEEARERDARLYGLKVFGLLLFALLFGAGVGWLLVI